MIGISVGTLNNYKKLTELVPELQDQVETGILAPATTIVTMKNFSENEARKDFSKAERIDYARRLERIESLKAEKRMKAGKADPMEIFPQGTTRDTVASKLGIGSGKQYEKEKYIVENQTSLTPEDFADWDVERIIPPRTEKHWRLMYLSEDINMEKLEEIIFRKTKMDSLKNQLSLKLPKNSICLNVIFNVLCELNAISRI